MKEVELVIKIPEETYEYWKEHKHEYVFAEAIANGVLLPEGAEILTKEAYGDLCMRASKAESER